MALADSLLTACAGIRRLFTDILQQAADFASPRVAIIVVIAAYPIDYPSVRQGINKDSRLAAMC